MLAAMVADALGAATEGLTSGEIADKTEWFPRGRPDRMVSATHMGIGRAGERLGYYTDDTEQALAIASSLVEMQRLDAEHCALRQVEFWAGPESCPPRGYPDTAERSLRAVHQKWTVCFCMFRAPATRCLG